MILHRLLTLVSNLLPLAGVLWWGWDIFEILILFWLQTVLLAAFAELHITKLPASRLGDITVNGVTRPATRSDLLLIFGLFALGFCGGHLLFLWVMFAGAWSARVQGPISFVQQLVIANGAWSALAFTVLAGIVSYLLLPPRAALLEHIAAFIGLRTEAENHENLGTIFLALFKRIFLMQAAIIFGGMLALFFGSMAPLLILIGLKTLIELAGGGPKAARVTTAIRT